MNRVIIHAYSAFNLGDDLFIKVLCERYPDTNFVLVAPRAYRTVFRKHKNLYVYPSDSLFIRGVNRVLRMAKTGYYFRDFLAKRCDVVVRIGGSLFIQPDGWKKPAISTEVAPTRRTPPRFLLGANFGPYSDTDYLNEHRNLFQQYSDICFRDSYSYELFRELGNVRKAPDVIFQLGRKDFPQSTNGSVVVSVIKPSFRPHLQEFDEKYYVKLAEVAVYLVDCGYEVILMSFCRNEDDELAIENIAKRIPEGYLGKVRTHYYRTNIDETLQIISGSSLVVATRFHAMILGWIFGKPVFPIAYSSKMTNVMVDVGFKGHYAEVSAIDAIEPEKVLSCIKTNIINVSEQIYNSDSQFQKLDSLLMKKPVVTLPQVGPYRDASKYGTIRR